MEPSLPLYLYRARRLIAHFTSCERERETMGGAKDKEKKEGGGGGGGEKKKDDGSITVVLKVDLHCEGCATKLKRSIKGFEGVQTVSADLASNKVTVVGKVGPSNLRDRVEAKARKKVDLLSPTKPKDAAGDGKGDKKAAGDGKDDKKAAGDGKDDKKAAGEKKPQVTTVVLKIGLHCEGCIKRIRNTVKKIKGVESVFIDAGKDLVTVKGTMDAKALPGILKDKLNRGVEIVPPKKDGDGGGGDKKKDGGGDKKKDGGGDKKDEGAKAAPAPGAEANKMEYSGPNGHGFGYRMDMAPAPQIFSDENPNACSVM